MKSDSTRPTKESLDRARAELDLATSILENDHARADAAFENYRVVLCDVLSAWAVTSGPDRWDNLASALAFVRSVLAARVQSVAAWMVVEPSTEEYPQLPERFITSDIDVATTSWSQNEFFQTIDDLW